MLKNTRYKLLTKGAKTAKSGSNYWKRRGWPLTQSLLTK